jgi:hypothetical protein
VQAQAWSRWGGVWKLWVAWGVGIARGCDAGGALFGAAMAPGRARVISFICD